MGTVAFGAPVSKSSENVKIPRTCPTPSDLDIPGNGYQGSVFLNKVLKLFLDALIQKENTASLTVKFK